MWVSDWSDNEFDDFQVIDPGRDRNAGQSPISHACCRTIRECIGFGGPRTRRLLASDSFLCKLERKLRGRLRPLPIGRPRKAKRKGAK